MRDVSIRKAAVGKGRKRRLRAAPATLLFGAAFGISGSALHAQESPATSVTNPTNASGQVDEVVVVTARKRSEDPQQIPASVQAVPESIIKQTHLTQLDDIGSFAPNLNIFEAHDNSPAVVMRGAGAFELVSGVGFYMDDVQLYEGQTVRPEDVARIEILKGPQGTLYGGANIGGAIKYITKDPTTTWQNQATVELGNHRTGNVSAIVSGPISDKLGVRASVYDDNSRGYITDTYHQETIGASHDRGGRLVFLAEPQDATIVRLSMNAESYSSQNENLQYRVSEIPAPDQPYTADAYRYSVDDFFIPNFTRKLFSSTLQVDHQFESGAKFTSITSQFWSLNRGMTDFTKKPIPLDLLFQFQDQRVVGQEFRLESGSHSNLQWLVGAFAEHHITDITNSDLNYTGDIPATPTTLAVDGTTPFDYDTQNKVQKVYALFGHATYYSGDWQYELGVRGENYKSNLKAQNAPSTGGLFVMAPQSLSATKVSPRASIQYKLNRAVNVYGTVMTGFTPGDLVEQNLAISSVRAETTTGYELGMKATLPHGGKFNAAVYVMDYKDRWYQTMVAIPGGFQDVTMNIGPSRNSGIEIDFLLPLSSQVKLSGGVGTTRAVWGNAQYGDPQLTAAGGGVVPVFRNLNGLTAPFTPAYTASLALDWNTVLSNGYKLGARLDGSAIGQSYWDPNDFARQKAYQLLNVGAHLETASWEWVGRVTNVTGTRFNTMYWDGTDVGIPHSFARINRPRMFAVSATYHF